MYIADSNIAIAANRQDSLPRRGDVVWKTLCAGCSQVIIAIVVAIAIIVIIVIMVIVIIFIIVIIVIIVTVVAASSGRRKTAAMPRTPTHHECHSFSSQANLLKL